MLNANFCSSLNFLSERPSDGKFKNCCHKGKVILKRPEYPSELKFLFSNEYVHNANFKSNIRNYNSSFAFASFGAKIKELSLTGPYCFRVHG